MNIALDGLYAVITGASSGLGFTMAKALLEKGATVALSHGRVKSWILQ